MLSSRLVGMPCGPHRCDLIRKYKLGMMARRMKPAKPTFSEKIPLSQINDETGDLEKTVKFYYWCNSQ